MSGSGSTSPQQLVHHRFPARADQLAAARAAVETACLSVGCSPRCTGDVVLAVDEACQNVIRHAYGGDPDGEIVLEVERDEDSLVVYLRDFAPTVDPAKIRPRDLDDVRPGGLGTHFIGAVMDEREFVASRSGVGNLLRMKKKIA